MKVHLANDINSKAIDRVIAALQRYAPPDVEFTDHSEADLIFYQVNGRLEHLKRRIEGDSKPYVIVQHAFKSTLNPEAADWLPVWKGAVLVWSHYDLPTDKLFRSPLGVDDCFYYAPFLKKYYQVLVHGTYLTEGVRECVIAAGNKPVAHLGDKFSRPNVEHFKDVSDDEVGVLYNSSIYVSGLRRVEGFELPAAEGLVCGARPILFDREHYRYHYGDLAEYIPEGPREQVLADLTFLFSRPERPVTAMERMVARERFNWSTIMKRFYANLALHFI